jgi:hypothetical protein
VVQNPFCDASSQQAPATECHVDERLRKGAWFILLATSA